MIIALCYVTWISCFLFKNIAAEIRLTKFRRPLMEGHNRAKSNISARSKIECADICAKDDLCYSFHFDKLTHLCHVAEAILNVPLDRMYSKDGYPCPVDHGFKLFVHDGMTLCLQYNPIKQDYDMGLKECEGLGGHLALIESFEMNSILPDILTHFGVTTSEYVYIDGFDRYNTDTFLTWKDESLPWELWAPFQPQHAANEDCLGIENENPYPKLHDFLCSDALSSLCQIELK